MSIEMLEQKLAELQKRVEVLETKVGAASKKDWRNAMGILKDDELSREAARLGAEWRAEDNKRR